MPRRCRRGRARARVGCDARASAALEAIRQGYQTNIWGMPTYYLMRSGYWKSTALTVEEFAVPSGNLTMQQMVARQVDLGTYAGPSFIIGNAKGGLVAIAMIEHVGKTARIMARKDLEHHQGRSSCAAKASPTRPARRSATIFVDTDHAAARTATRATTGSPHGREQHGGRARRQDRRRHGQRRALQRHRRRRRHRHRPGGFFRLRPMPVFMAATPEFVQKKPDTMVAYLKAWLDAAQRLQGQAEEGRRRDLHILRRQGLQDVARDVRDGAVPRRGQSRLSRDLKPYMQKQAEILLQGKNIKAIPDWSTALRPDFHGEGQGRGVIRVAQNHTQSNRCQDRRPRHRRRGTSLSRPDVRIKDRMTA